MPTHEEAARFWRDWDCLTREQQERFAVARRKFVACLRDLPISFAAGLRVKAIQGSPGVWEMTWAPDGRATFTYGAAQKPGEVHIVWRRIGTHDIFRQP